MVIVVGVEEAAAAERVPLLQGPLAVLVVLLHLVGPMGGHLHPLQDFRRSHLAQNAHLRKGQAGDRIASMRRNVTINVEL